MTSRTTDPSSDPALAPSARMLLRAEAVRKCAQRLLMLALDARLDDWTVDLDRLAPTADFVAGVVRERYPRLDVPVHSRWRHFVFGGRDLWEGIVANARWDSADAAARSAFDLVITSVLLDAGAGAQWHYQDRATGVDAARSEGLALASLRWFAGGGLANDPGAQPLRADAAALSRIDGPAIQQAFQASETNPLLGLDGRAALLNRLGQTVESRPDLFASADAPRPGGLFDALRARAAQGQLPAATILQTLLEALGPIWLARPTLGGVPLGDCWPHPALATTAAAPAPSVAPAPASAPAPALEPAPAEGYAPLHKLSQWLSYSLLEPLQKAGITVTNVHELTGLAEYRNGGLFVDMGVLVPREAASLSKTYTVSDPFVVGWRSLTVALLDRLAPLVAARLGRTPESLPLASILEGGTWAAGRLIARKARADGGPPFHVLSDGTVF